MVKTHHENLEFLRQSEVSEQLIEWPIPIELVHEAPSPQAGATRDQMKTYGREMEDLNDELSDGFTILVRPVEAQVNPNPDGTVTVVLPEPVQPQPSRALKKQRAQNLLRKRSSG